MKQKGKVSMGQAVREYWAELGKQIEDDTDAPKRYYVMEDMKPYMAVAGDMTGKEVSGRRAHREFLKRNNFIEVGNEKGEFERHRGASPDNYWVQKGRQRG